MIRVRKNLKRFTPLPLTVSRKPKDMKPKFRETLFGDIKYPIDVRSLTDCNVAYFAQSEMEWSQQKTRVIPSPRTPTEEEVLKIYEDVSTLGDIERHLNIVYKPFSCFATTPCEFNITKLKSLMDYAIFEPDKQLSVTIQRFAPICSLKIYPNGNVYCQAYSQEGTRTGLVKIRQELNGLGYNFRFRRLTFNVVNATFCVPFHLNLMQFHLQDPVATDYDPLRQPFLTYKMRGTMVKLAIFPTGYVFVLFATTRGFIKLAIARILPLLYGLKDEDQDQSKLGLSCGDIDYKVLWEKYFQDSDDLLNDW
ncbi:uncharacterized protein Trf5 [Drosophila takahashii]|uniref:uncharacterized protein Trf5 n=1 Tax=Drosophila takahashii TaxID=29030 RepID=UPI0038996819